VVVTEWLKLKVMTVATVAGMEAPSLTMMIVTLRFHGGDDDDDDDDDEKLGYMTITPLLTSRPTLLLLITTGHLRVPCHPATFNHSHHHHHHHHHHPPRGNTMMIIIIPPDR